jgi:AcrR family transcriptional regulator
MAPPRKHETDAILDATRALVLAGGPRAAGVAAIAEASGAPAGTLYHRFGSRDGVLIAVWLRALDRFQSRVLAVADDSLDAAVAMAGAAVGFARERPDDARLLVTLSPADLLDGRDDADFAEALRQRNAPLIERLRAIARELYGTAEARALEAVYRAVVDLPHAAVRRHVGAVPSWLDGDVGAAARALLLDAQARRRRSGRGNSLRPRLARHEPGEGDQAGGNEPEAEAGVGVPAASPGIAHRPAANSRSDST